MTVIPSTIQKLLALSNHQECPTCRASGWTPAGAARPCFHRHHDLPTRVTDHTGNLIREFGKSFATNNEATNVLLTAGLSCYMPLIEEIQKTGAPLPKELLFAILQILRERAPELIKEAQQRCQANNAPAEPPQEFPEQATWEAIRAPLIEKVLEENYDLWLSPLVALPSEDTFNLGCPNTFFQEYLDEHYKDVIRQELVNVGETREIEFLVYKNIEEPPAKQEAPTPEPPTEILPKEEFATPALQKIARRKAARRDLATQCVIKRDGKYELFGVMYADALNLIKAQEDEEDRFEQERARFERWQAIKAQRPKDSTFDSTKQLDRKQLKKGLKQLERELDDG